MFTAMLDPETTTVLMTKGIYGNYNKSRKELGNWQVELADDDASDPMDIGLAKHCWFQNHSVVSTHIYHDTDEQEGPQDPVLGIRTGYVEMADWTARYKASMSKLQAECCIDAWMVKQLSIAHIGEHRYRHYDCPNLCRE